MGLAAVGAVGTELERATPPFLKTCRPGERHVDQSCGASVLHCNTRRRAGHPQSAIAIGVRNRVAIGGEVYTIGLHDALDLDQATLAITAIAGEARYAPVKPAKPPRNRSTNYFD